MKMELDSSPRCTKKGKRQQLQVVPREIWMRSKEEALCPVNCAALWPQAAGGLLSLRISKLSWRGFREPRAA